MRRLGNNKTGVVSMEVNDILHAQLIYQKAPTV